MQEVALSLPEAISFPEWIGVGRELADKKKNIDWLIGDWIGYGRTNYPQQIDLALGDMALDTKHLRQIERTVKAFPPHLRDASLSFDHHVHVACLPTQEALPFLKRAHDEKTPARALRLQVMAYKMETGAIFTDDDPDDKFLRDICVAWNLAPAHVREEFIDMARESHLGVIDA